MGSYQKINAYTPEWMKDFSCLGANCPKTCCKGWNIPVDQDHAEKYENLDDSELTPNLVSVFKKIRTRKNGRQENRYFLKLLDQEGDICPLLDNTGLCSLQNKYGPEILCTTCYFFPKILWQIEDQWSLSASLSCPVVLRKAILDQNPIRFLWMETDQDPDSEWLDISFVSDKHLQILLLNRQKIVNSMISLLQNQNDLIPNKLFRVCAFLNRLGTLLNSEKSLNFDDMINDAVDFVQKNGNSPVRSVESVEDLTRWIQLLSLMFNWGLESSARYHTDIRNDFLQVLAYAKNPVLIMAENYLFARNQVFQPFIRNNPYLIENFLVHFIFSDFLKQFSIYQNEITNVSNILNYEILQLCAIYSLMQFLFVKESLISGEMDSSIFMDVIYQADQSYLHYPTYIHQSLCHYPNTPLKEEDIRILLSC